MSGCKKSDERRTQSEQTRAPTPRLLDYGIPEKDDAAGAQGSLRQFPPVLLIGPCLTLLLWLRMLGVLPFPLLIRVR